MVDAAVKHFKTEMMKNICAISFLVEPGLK